MIKGNILIVDDNKAVLTALEMLLFSEFEKVTTLSNPSQIESKMLIETYQVILLDMNFNAGINTGNEGLFWLHEIKDKYPNTEVVMFTAYGDVELAVRAVKEGANDFILKPWDNAKLIITLRNAMKLAQKEEEVKLIKKKEKLLKQTLNPNSNLIIGESQVIKNMLTIVQKVSQTDANILITGENGTGKELVARAIHQQSKRSEQIMVSVDMGAIPETLFESELFGHVKGAFTDAKESRAGKIEAADKGTLFLDEIGNLPLSLQAKLLTAIQQQVIYRVGSNKPIKVDFRLICATNNNLYEMVSQKLFREDLLYRIETIQVAVPPLRERNNDIIIIAEHYLKKFASHYHKQDLVLNDKCKQRILDHHWPGNVRELEHAIEKAVILSDNSKLDDSLFWFNTRSDEQPFKSDSTIAEMEVKLIEQAMKSNEQNLSAASKQLGITRQTLYNKIKKYNI